MIREMFILPCNIDIYTSFLLILRYILRKDNIHVKLHVFINVIVMTRRECAVVALSHIM